MTHTCTKVTVRQRAIRNNRISLYLDYYPAARSAEREGFEPTTLTAYISATLLSKFQIGNETVTIFRRWACPTLTSVCLPNFRVQR